MKTVMSVTWMVLQATAFTTVALVVMYFCLVLRGLSDYQDPSIGAELINKLNIAKPTIQVVKN